MCWNCGCMLPDDDHGNHDNITTERLKKAAKAGGTETLRQLMENMVKTYLDKVRDTPIDTAPV